MKARTKLRIWTFVTSCLCVPWLFAWACERQRRALREMFEQREYDV